MRVVTWNVWWKFGPWERRAAGIEATLRAVDADIICLQEVWAEDDHRQADQLARALGLHVVSSADPAADRHLGNAILSRWPITDSAITTLPAGSGREGRRTLVRARLASPVGPVNAYSTHLAYRFDESSLRSAQLATVCETVAADRAATDTPFPPVLCGDLNATPQSDEIRMLTGSAPPPVPGLVFTDAWDAVGIGPGHTWDARNPHLRHTTWPDRRLDYVLVGWPRDKPLGNPRRARLAGARRHGGVWPSDHLAVVVDLHAGDPDA